MKRQPRRGMSASRALRALCHTSRSLAPPCCLRNRKLFRGPELPWRLPWVLPRTAAPSRRTLPSQPAHPVASAESTASPARSRGDRDEARPPAALARAPRGQPRRQAPNTAEVVQPVGPTPAAADSRRSPTRAMPAPYRPELPGAARQAAVSSAWNVPVYGSVRAHADPGTCAGAGKRPPVAPFGRITRTRITRWEPGVPPHGPTELSLPPARREMSSLFECL